MLSAVLQTIQRLRGDMEELIRSSHIRVQHLFLLSLVIPCLPLVLPLFLGIYITMDVIGWLAAKLSLSKSRPSRPSIWLVRQRLKADLSAFKWLMHAVDFAPVVIHAYFVLLISGLHPWPSGGRRVRRTVGNIDIYAPATDHAREGDGLHPIVVLVHGVYYGPLECRKWMMAPIAIRLRNLGYCVVVPEIDTAKTGSMETMIRDLRGVLSWIALHAGEDQGDPDQLYVMGHGFGAYLPLLLVVQSAAVQSRDDFKPHHPEAVLSNGLNETRMYAQEIDIPPIKGLILLAPMCDTQKYLEWEWSQDTINLSPMRGIFGPRLRTCLFHSPAHLLFAARSVLSVEHLPSKFLFIHGGRDMVVRSSQTEMMHELLVGAGVRKAHKSIYPSLNHIDLLNGLYGLNTNGIHEVLKDVTTFTTS